jgi:hypothetical protein
LVADGEVGVGGETGAGVSGWVRPFDPDGLGTGLGLVESGIGGVVMLEAGGTAGGPERGWALTEAGWPIKVNMVADARKIPIRTCFSMIFKGVLCIA